VIEKLFEPHRVLSPVPTFARSGSGKWHVVGPDGCRYGEEFAAESEPDETVTATDIVAYEPPEDPKQSSSPSVSISLSTGGSSFPRGRTDDQRLVLPSTVTDSDSDLCGSCRSELERQQNRRSRIITGLKQVTTRRDVDWGQTDHNTRRACDWCQAYEFTTNNGLGATVCPACQRLFETPLGEPTDDAAPETDRLPESPTEPITPIVFGTALPEYDPTELVGSNRPSSSTVRNTSTPISYSNSNVLDTDSPPKQSTHLMISDSRTQTRWLIMMITKRRSLSTLVGRHAQ